MSETAVRPRQAAYRFSGHETFACRYAWLPKAYAAIKADPNIFADETAAMIELGLGKNMVRSLRFWVEAMGVAEPNGSSGLRPTAFADAVLGPDGRDPFLEDPRTSWLLHWKLASRRDGALFAWHQLLNRWPHPEFTRGEALASFARESVRLGHSHSEVTLAQHLDVFLHTYLAGRSKSVGAEDSLDGPLIDLDFLRPVGQRRNEKGRWEPTLAFRREPKAEIVPTLFDYCLEDWWARFRPGEETVTEREAAMGDCSPGQAFKLPEDDVRSRLEHHPASDRRPFAYRPSAVQGLIVRRRDASPTTLADVYAEEIAHD